MDIDQLVAFERIVREGSFSKAAWSLGIAQPTVSARIAALETELGGLLFKRGRKVALTERGIGFLPYARRALATLQDGLEAARLAQAGQRGKLNVGVLRSLSGGLFGPAVLGFHQDFPEVECRVREGDHWSLVDWLCDRLLDLALICWPCLDPLLADMTPVVQLREQMVFAVSPQHPLAKPEGITQAEILAHSSPFLLLRWWQVTPLEIAQLVAQARFVLDVPNETGRYLIASGQGGGFFSRPTILPDLEAGRAVEVKVLDMAPIYRDTALVHLARQDTLSPAAANFVERLQLEAKVQGLSVQGREQRREDRGQ